MAWTTPQGWWLLALAVLFQGVGLLRLALAGRWVAQRSMRVPRWAVALVALGALLGLAYALPRHDLVFAAGQVGMLLLAWIGSRAT